MYAARLAHYDSAQPWPSPGRLPRNGRNLVARTYWNIALRIADENPVGAERVLRLVPKIPGEYWLPSLLAWKMAQVDPALAQRLVDEAQRSEDHPQRYLFLALGLKSRDPAAAEEAFWKAIEGIDRVMKDGHKYMAMQGVRGVLLPIVEQIDPTLVPELFWRAVATRLPIGNPATRLAAMPAALTTLLSFYNRDVAAAIFEPVRAEIEQTDERELVSWGSQFLGWLLFDPLRRQRRGSSELHFRRISRWGRLPESGLQSCSGSPSKIGGERSGPSVQK